MTGLTLANGRYVLGEALGHGGSAQVFRARRSSDSQDFAAKIIRIEVREDARALAARYERLAELRHPHILEILDIGISHDALYIISPLAAEGSLRQLLHRSQLEPQRALQIIRHVADALQYVHTRGLLHLDVKPANILLAAGGTPLLSDFGLQQPEPAPDGRKRVRGTPAYMAPEQCTLAPVGPPTDQYALGITSFELLTGRRPFSGSTPDDMLRRQVVETPPLPTSVNRALPHQVDAVVLKALAKDPRDRYAHIAAFADALVEAMASARRVAPPPATGAETEPTTEVLTLQLRPTARHQRM